MNLADALSGRAKLEGIQWMLHGAEPRKALRHELCALLSAPNLLGFCELRHVRFRPGRRLTACYDIHLRAEDAGRHSVRPMEVTWRPHGNGGRHHGTVDLSEMQAEAVRRGVSAPFRQLVADVPAWGMQVQVSPLDARFPQLVRVSDPRYVCDLVAGAYAASDVAQDQAPASQYAVTSIRYHPGNRHMLRYDPLDAPERGTLFAKLYKGEDGERAFHVATRVAEWLAQHGEGVTSVRPLAYATEDAVVLYPRILGEPLSQHLRRLGPGVGRGLAAVGAALYALHHLPPKLAGPLKLHDFAAEAKLIRRFSEHFLALLPPVGEAINVLLDRAQELHERLPQEWPTFTYGDFKTDHLWVTSGGLTLIDFDTCRFSDPALDVGKFLADLQFWYATYDQPGLEQAQEQFLAGYGPGAPAERLMRARLYEAIELVKMAGRRVYVFEPDWASRAQRLIGRAQAVMNDLQLALGLPVARRENTLSECVQPIVDPGLATLSEVLDPIALAKHLRASCLSAGNGGAVEQVQVRILRRKVERRCTLEIGMRNENGWHSVIGKVHATDRSDVFQAMEGIRQAGFGPQDEFSIPQPLAYLSSLRLLLQEKVEGPLASEVLRATDERSRAGAAERCARWLARFHALAPNAGPVFDSDCCLSLMRQRSLRIAKLGGRCADKAARLLQRLEDEAASLGTVEMCAGHGSYSAAQLILAEGRTVVFDWDGYDVADPARDVARFLAALHRLALGRLSSIRALDGAAEVFLGTYLAEGRPEAERNLCFYKAAACVKLAKYKANNSVPRWKEKTEAMLDEGLRVLDREATR